LKGEINLINRLQLAIQILFLALFLTLIATGQVQVWVGIFLLGVIASFFLGRLYCGWICPINTVLKGISWSKKFLGIKKQITPQFLTKPWVRFTVLFLFIAAFAFSMITGRPIPALPILFAAGIMLTIFFPEELWHRYLCPYGTILSYPARKAKLNMVIDQEKCNSCGVCKKVCPADAVHASEKVYSIRGNNCLVCLNCSTHCKAEAINYCST
jgi:ferredoxin-type protein NapH